jgi:hypothetical protein
MNEHCPPGQPRSPTRDGGSEPRRVTQLAAKTAGLKPRLLETGVAEAATPYTSTNVSLC